ncbi:CoA pyrophosphatase [Saccharopolyspora tripterygii]
MSENGPLVDPADLPEWMRTLVKRTADLDPGHFGWPKDPPPASARAAAVLILLGEGERGPEVLLLRRADGLNSHPGQVAFPGGSLDDVDSGPVDAALREAVEEVGVRLDGIRPVATLPELHVPHSGFRVTPVLAHWTRPSPVAPVDPGETAAVARVPISWLTDPENRVRVRLTSGFAGPAFLVPGMLVWGFTGGLLAGLLELAGWSRSWDRSDVRGLDEAWHAAEEADDIGIGRS